MFPMRIFALLLRFHLLTKLQIRMKKKTQEYDRAREQEMFEREKESGYLCPFRAAYDCVLGRPRKAS